VELVETEDEDKKVNNAFEDIEENLEDAQVDLEMKNEEVAIMERNIERDIELKMDRDETERKIYEKHLAGMLAEVMQSRVGFLE
jgi:hypothetical protein